MFSQVVIIAMFATLFSSSAFHMARSTKASSRSLKMVVVDPDVPGQIAPTGQLGADFTRQTHDTTRQ